MIMECLAHSKIHFLEPRKNNKEGRNYKDSAHAGADELFPARGKHVHISISWQASPSQGKKRQLCRILYPLRLLSPLLFITQHQFLSIAFSVKKIVFPHIYYFLAGGIFHDKDHWFFEPERPGFESRKFIIYRLNFQKTQPLGASVSFFKTSIRQTAPFPQACYEN